MQAAFTRAAPRGKGWQEDLPAPLGVQERRRRSAAAKRTLPALTSRISWSAVSPPCKTMNISLTDIAATDAPQKPLLHWISGSRRSRCRQREGSFHVPVARLPFALPVGKGEALYDSEGETQGTRDRALNRVSCLRATRHPASEKSPVQFSGTYSLDVVHRVAAEG